MRAQHRNDAWLAAENWIALFRGEDNEEALAAALRLDKIMDLVEAFVLAHRKDA